MARCRLLLAGLMVLGFAACTDDTTDNPADGTEVTEDEVANITDDELDALALLSIDGGYLAIERPTKVTPSPAITDFSKLSQILR